MLASARWHFSGTFLLASQAAVLGACSLTTPLDGLSTGGAPASASGQTTSATGQTTASSGTGGFGPTSTGAGPTSSSSVGSGASSSSVGTGGNMAPCPSGRGPDMVHIVSGATHLCIDSTEVTASQYAQFVVDKNGDTSGQSADCLWNMSYFDGNPPAGDLPITFVDQCDAKAFCKWAGKRLCGPLPNAPSTWQLGDPFANEWLFACSKGGTQTWPYGNTPIAGNCNFSDVGSQPRPVGSLPGCEGGFPGIFDMTGNVWEWLDRCDQTDACFFGGGAFMHQFDIYNCMTFSSFAQSAQTSDIGFRCCATPS